MKIIKNSAILALFLCSAACTGENGKNELVSTNLASEQSKPRLVKIAAGDNDAGLPQIPKSSSSATAAKAAIERFYAALKAQDCKTAISLRPGYSEARCKSISKSTINALRIEYSDADKAAAYINFSYVKAGAAKEFAGYLWLKRNGQKWQIQENFAPVSKMGLDEFMSNYVQSDYSTPTQQTGSVDMPVTDDAINGMASHNSLLARLRSEYGNHSAGNIILVDNSEQRLYLYNAEDQLLGEFPVSNATKGVGNLSGSEKTPLGAHRISERFGDGASLGTIFTARRNTGKIAKIIKEAVDLPEDLVTTRILWLDGLEPGKNQGGNVDSHSRYIYIHGTPEEGLIGQPASHGCVRMKNKDVIKVFQAAPLGTLVYIGK